MENRFNLLRTFAVLAFTAITVISSISGYFLFRYLSQHLLERDMVISAEFIQSIALINNPDAFFQGKQTLRENPEIKEFFQHITRIPDVLRATVYNTDQTVIWSDNKALLGKRFSDNDELIEALKGKPVFARETTNDPDSQKAEHRFLPEHVEEFVESYLPVWDYEHENVIGVLELYKSPNALFTALNQGKWLVLTISVLGGGLLFLVLFWVVRKASMTIDNQASALQDQIEQLSDLLKQNQELRNRIQQASSRAVELNEDFLRRVGAELHDGPAQSLGYALLRLDSVKNELNREPSAESLNEFQQIKISLDEALTEIRSLSAGLVMPELTQLSLKESLEKAVRTHEKRTETTVEFKDDNLPEDCPLPLKICAYRFAQEGLNNAYRHAKDSTVNFYAEMKLANLILVIVDQGPGFEMSQLKPSSSSGLGLHGLRDRIESLGGEFLVQSQLGAGTTIKATMPLHSGSMT